MTACPPSNARDAAKKRDTSKRRTALDIAPLLIATFTLERLKQETSCHRLEGFNVITDRSRHVQSVASVCAPRQPKSKNHFKKSCHSNGSTNLYRRNDSLSPHGEPLFETIRQVRQWHRPQTAHLFKRSRGILPDTLGPLTLGERELTVTPSKALNASELA